MGMRSTEVDGTGRALRIVAGVLGVLLVLLVLPYTVVSVASSAPDQTIHRFHNAAGAIASLIAAAALLVLAWRPRGNPAAVQLVCVAGVVSLVAGFLAGDPITGLYFIPAIVAVVVAAVDPWRTVALRSWTARWSLLAAAVIAAIPSIAYTLTQASLQRHGLPADVHAQMHHYSGLAVTALAMPATVLVAAVGAQGWHLVAWIGGVAFALFGIVGLAFAHYVGAPASGWAWASIAAGVVTVGAAEVERRRAPDEP
jgi:fucose 4-O-acetylase-like acetyltransferase